jgi:hypothetical protein
MSVVGNIGSVQQRNQILFHICGRKRYVCFIWGTDRIVDVGEREEEEDDERERESFFLVQ